VVRNSGKSLASMTSSVGDVTCVTNQHWRSRWWDAGMCAGCDLHGGG
jgi:hypothetical protein